MIYTFVEHSHGSMEGSVYDNVILNDGLLALKVKNGLTDSTTLKDIKEGDKVSCQFEVKGSKTLAPRCTLIKIEKESKNAVK